MNHLTGKNILLTRTVAQNSSTARLVQSFGATPVFFPCIHIRFLHETIAKGLAQLALLAPGETDIIFSSGNGVEAVAANTASLADALAGFRIVAVGDKTADMLNLHGVKADLVPVEASQQGLIALYQQQGLPKQAFFFRAEEGSDALAAYFASQGANLELIPCYRSECLLANPAAVITQLREGNIDAVLIGSAKTAGYYLQKVQDLTLANRPAIAVMSPQVALAADKLGLKVQVIAEQPGFKAMLEGLNQYFAPQI